jgi:hypothetical protein
MGKIGIVYRHFLCDENGEPNEYCKRIAESKPYVVLTPAVDSWSWSGKKNLTPQVIAFLHSKNILVFGHIDGTGLGWLWAGSSWSACEVGKPSLNDWDTVTKPAIDEVLAIGCDGVSDGEVFNMRDPTDKCGNSASMYWDYYKKYSDYVRSFGKKVLFNTGTWYTSESLMQLCDVLSVELSWREFTDPANVQVCGWRTKYQPERFFGVVQGRMGLQDAINGTLEMQQKGIGIACLDVGTGLPLPDWFEDYMEAVTPAPPIFPRLREVLYPFPYVAKIYERVDEIRS